MLGHGALAFAQVDIVLVRNLYRTGLELSNNTRYLEAIDLFQEAKALIENAEGDHKLFHADVLYSEAEAKIKARIHQGFPAIYVKSALKDVQAANRLRESAGVALPLKLAEGYYLEGYIHKRFFMRVKQARELFKRCIKLDPGHSAAKRELSEVLFD